MEKQNMACIIQGISGICRVKYRYSMIKPLKYCHEKAACHKSQIRGFIHVECPIHRQKVDEWMQELGKGK